MIVPLSLSVILIVIFLASVFRITITVSVCGVTKPMYSNEVFWEEVTLTLCEPGGTNLLKWPK